MVEARDPNAPSTKAWYASTTNQIPNHGPSSLGPDAQMMTPPMSSAVTMASDGISPPINRVLTACVTVTTPSPPMKPARHPC